MACSGAEDGSSGSGAGGASGTGAAGGRGGSSGGGATGASGAQGASGAAGASAAQGASGAIGASGAQGASGSLGAGGTLGQGGSGGSGVDAGGAGTGGSGGTSGGGTGGTGGSGGSSGAPTCGGSMMRPGETNGTISVGGVSRSYILHVPPSYSGSTPVPLVVDFHPLLMDAAYQRTNSGYAQLADQEGFVVAFPDGIDNAWNIGPCCTRSRTVDDQAFARALVDRIKGQGCIDPKRVYAAGFSMGGGFSHYLACNAADVFAAVAPAAFDLLTADEEPCNPSRPITVISFRGTSDPIVPYAGGASRPPNGLNVTIHFLGARGTFQRWAELDGCTGTPTAATGGCETYTQCRAGTEVTLCTTQGGGHATGDAKTGWNMMKRHPIP